MLQEVRLIATDVGERIVRCGGRDQRVEPGGTVEAFPGEVERMVDQETVWEAVGDVAERPTLEQLRQQAGELDIAGRSKMDREQLEAAIATVETSGGNPIGAVGDPEAIAAANALAETRGDSPTAFGVAEQDDQVLTRSSEDVREQLEVEPGAEPEPQPVASETAGTVGGSDQEPPAEVATGDDADLQNLSDDDLSRLARDRGILAADEQLADRDEVIELLEADRKERGE